MSLDYFGSKLLLKKWLYVEVIGGEKKLAKENC